MGKLAELFKPFTKAKFRFIHWVLLLYIFFIPLWPKIPFRDVEYTYINIRYEDIFLGFLAVLFVIEILRGKARILKNPYLRWIVLYWVVVFIAFLYGHFISKTVPVFNIGLLHSLRRVEYMFPFFVFFALVENARQFRIYAVSIFLALFGVIIYAFGQKFIGWPAYLTMNPVFSTGIPLLLKYESRIASTFGGHYDLGAFLVVLIPSTLAMFAAGKKKYGVLFFLSLLVLVYTASRTSFISYIVSATALLIFLRKWKMSVVIIAISAVMMLFTRDLTDRFMKTFSVRQILVNNKTGQVYVPKRVGKDELPAGSLYVPLNKNKSEKLGTAVTNLKKDILAEEKIKNASAAALSGNDINSSGSSEQNLEAVSGVVYDISSATRLQVEWPRAINAFLSNPLLGTGPSSITEATDGDYFRAVGETGILGFTLLFGIVLFLQKEFFFKAKTLAKNAQYAYYGVVFGAFGLMINAIYIDVFEASKIAFFVWCLWGIYAKALEFSKADINKAFE
ncbi:MAG: O-antigen ligase family protein [Candidatus Roizmanbacteria bacterium]|nr:O-antigen ligase family protein [Candidatus Roizmanbacteria bacterium]